MPILKPMNPLRKHKPKKTDKDGNLLKTYILSETAMPILNVLSDPARHPPRTVCAVVRFQAAVRQRVFNKKRREMKWDEDMSPPNPETALG